MTRRRPRLTPPDTPFPYTTLFLSRLNTVNISQASADQRAGRAGRVAEGWCYRLWPASRRLEPARTPAIAQLDLARSGEQTSELQSLMRASYAVFCLNKKKHKS